MRKLALHCLGRSSTDFHGHVSGSDELKLTGSVVGTHDLITEVETNRDRTSTRTSVCELGGGNDRPGPDIQRRSCDANLRSPDVPSQPREQRHDQERGV